MLINQLYFFIAIVGIPSYVPLNGEYLLPLMTTSNAQGTGKPLSTAEESLQTTFKEGHMTELGKYSEDKFVTNSDIT